MAKQYPGPYADLMHPSNDDAIYSVQNSGPQHYGTGMLNEVNPMGIGQPNNNAINGAFGAGGDPYSMPTSPNYAPAASLVLACQKFAAWYATEHPDEPSKKEKKQEKQNQ